MTLLAAMAAAALVAACSPETPGNAAAVQSASADLDRSRPPAPLEPRPLAFPEFHELTLENGLQVIHVEHRSQPVASITLYVRSGSASDPASLAGIAGLAANVLTKGTQTRTALDIAETIEGAGGSLNASASSDSLSVSASMLAEDLALGMELVADVVRRPSFPAEEVELARTRALSSLRAELGQAGTIARRRFGEFVYGPEHPYGVERTPDTVAAITRDDLIAFHAAAMHPGNALLVVAGAVDRTRAEQLVAEHFGDWEAADSVPVEFPAAELPAETTIHLVHRPGSVQSTIFIGHLGIRPDNPDTFALQVMNRILGGGTDARLFRILREERGWTYGSYSRLTSQADLGSFSASAEVRNEVTGDAVAEIVHQLQRLRDEPVPDGEFQAAVDYLVGNYPLGIQTPAQIGRRIANARLLGQPISHVIEYRERIREITPHDVLRVAREYVHPDQAAIVVVADAAVVMEQLEGIAPIRLYDIEGMAIEREALGATPAEAAGG